MKCLFSILLVSTLHFAGSTQNLYFIGEKGYACTEVMNFEPNYSERHFLEIVVARDANDVFLAISTNTIIGEKFVGKLVLYLKDGSTIVCDSIIAEEKIDDRTKALYKLTLDQVIKLKKVSIHSVKYSLQYLAISSYTSSNERYQTHDIITRFLGS